MCADVCCFFSIGFVFENEFINWFNIHDPLVYFWLLPLGIMTASFFQVFNYWCTHIKRFRRLAASRLLQSVFTILCQFLFAFIFGPQSRGLVGGYIIGQFFAVVVLGLFILVEDKRLVSEGINLDAIINQAKRHKKFPLFNSWPSLCDSLRVALPVMFLSNFFGNAVTGYYSIAMRVLWLPSSLLGMSISQVLFKRIADEYNRAGKTGPLIEKVFLGLSVISLPYLVLMLLSPFFFEYIFGPEWKTPGQYALILAPATALMFVVSPLSVTTTACNRQEISAGWQLFALILTAVVLVGSFEVMNVEGFLLALCLNNILLYVVYLILIFKVAGASFHRVMNHRLFFKIKTAY
jgi:O-antigen/teichoic acid export membrane protein